jgi:hypothetical protein
MQKKGALELSVNTIVIVVIGVALLSLGLIFVRNTFGGLTKMSDDIFGTAETQIGELHTGSKLTTPSTVNVKQGQVVRTNIFVGNDNTMTSCTGNIFSIDLGDTPGATQVDNGVGPAITISAKLISKNHIKIEPGEEATFVVAVAATKNAPLSSGLLEGAINERDFTVQVTAKCDSDVYNTGAFIVNVQKGGGLFS